MIATNPQSGETAPREATLRRFSTTFDTLRLGLDPRKGFTRDLERNEFTRFRIGSRQFVSTTNADHVDHVLHANRLNYEKSVEYDTMFVGAGINLLNDEGDSWAQHRAAVNPMFAKRRLNELVDLIVDPIESMGQELAACEGRTVIDLHELMVQMTLRVVANALFNQDFGSVVDRMHDLGERGMRVAELYIRLSLVGLLPRVVWRRVIAPIVHSKYSAPPPLRAAQQVVRDLKKAVADIVAERKANPTDTPDLLNMLLEAEGDNWGSERVHDETLVFMFAGHETTANALSWFWYLMALHPQYRDAMFAEVDSVLQGRRLCADDFANLPWTTACIMESQRYFSSVPLIPRTAVDDDVIDGHQIRKGTTVLMLANAIHHSERYWTNPEEFDPERFMPDAPRPARSTYLPFGGGRRVCIGQSFALMEMVAVAAALSQRFVFDLAPGHPVELSQSLTLRPKYGILTTVRPRTFTQDATGPTPPRTTGCPMNNASGREVSE